MQSAQDDLQRVSGNPLYVSLSRDATGRGRHQVLDRDWTVCTQSVAAGQAVGPDTEVTFGVVRLDETCP